MSQTEIIFGYHASIAVLENPQRIILSLECTEEFFKRNKNLIEKRNIRKVEILKRKMLDIKINNNIHQGIILNCKKLEKKTFDSIDNREKFIILLDSLTDSQNVGSIMRSSYLYGISTIIYNKDNSFEISPFLIKSASGAYEKMKMIEVVNLSRSLELLKKKGFWITGLDNNSNLDLETIPKDTKKALILGSEKKGLRDLLKKKCDYIAKVNMHVKDKLIDSLNVSNSAAIAIYTLSKK